MTESEGNNNRVISKEQLFEWMKTYREKLIQDKASICLRLAGLDHPEYLYECAQFLRDCRLYIALDAAIMAFSYLPEQKAQLLAHHVCDTIGLLQRELGEPTYCRVCGTRNKKAFDRSKSILICASCYDEVGEPQACVKCGKRTYDGDLIGEYVVTPAGSKFFSLAAGEIVPKEKIIQEFGSIEDCQRMGLITICFDEGIAQWYCEDCLQQL